MLKKFLNKKRKSTEQGMSLAEILVSVGLIVLLGAAITTTAITLSSSTSDFTKASVTQHEAQETISEMTRDISAATNITTAQDYRISLETQEDNTKYEVSYFYWNPDNSAYVSIPTGVITGDLPDFPAIMQWRKEKGASTGKLSVAAPGYSVFQQNRTLFTYYDQANATMITPVASTKLSEIKRVDFGFSLKVEDRPARIELASGATPRYTAAEPSTSGSQTASKVDGCVAPQLLPTTTITPRTKFATINWVPVVGANTYTIYRENDNQETNPMVVAVINDYNVTSYVDETVKWGETYRYYMVSGCTIGTSPNGDGMTFTVTPDQPAFVNINTKKDVTDIQQNTTETGTTNPAKDKVYTVARGLTNQLSWTKMNGALGYIIYRSGVQIARVGPDTTSYQDYGRSFGDATPYTVVAFNVGSNGSGGASAASNPQTLISPPAKSTIIVAKPDTSTDSTNTNNVITIATRASNTTGYQVYKTSTSAASADCANVSRDKNLDFTTNSKTDVVEWGTHSCYVLIGYNDAGVGEFSDNIEAKQKPGKFSVYSLSSTSHQRIDTGAPLPGNAVCWTANVPDDITCDGNYYRGEACCTPLAMFTNEGKTNITIAWNSSKNAYGDYIIYQDRTETSGVVDQGDDNITANRVYNNANQGIVFNNQMPGSLFAYNIDAYAANGEIRKVNGAPLAHVSKPDIPRYANINRQSKSGAPWYQRRVTIGIDGTPVTIRGTTDNVIYEADTNGYTSATFGNWGRYTAYTNTFNGPMTGWINVYDRMTRLGVTNYSAGVGSTLIVTGNGCGPCYSYYADTPESYPNYWAGHSPVYYAGGYASGTTIEGGSTEAMPTPTPPGPPQEGLPDPLTEQCKNIYESDPKFRNEYGCEFGTGIPSPTAYSYLQHMDGTTARIWWNIVPFATGYEIRVDYLGGETQKTYVAGGQTNTKDVVLVDGVINTITIITKNAVNVSSPSEPFLVDMPGIPQNVTMNTFVGKTANVTWDAVENVNKYLVTMISGGENYSYEVTSPTIDITIADAAAGGTVWVQSVKEVGSEDGSPAISSKSEPIVIAASEAPNNFKLISLTDQTAKLGWDKSIGAVTYKITGTYTGPTSTVTQIPEIIGVTALTYDLTGIPYARTVTLNVQAVNPNGISAKSNTVTFDVLPPKPTNVTLTSNDSLGKTSTTPSTIAWTKAACVVGNPQYKLSRVTPNAAVIRDYGNTNFVPISATGGTISTYTQNGITYQAHTFTANGTFTVTNAGNNGAQVDYLIIGGGGSGGHRLSGGGGAGGVLQGSMSVTATAYPIVIGNGGAAQTNQATGVNGGNTTALGLTALGGGGGGGYNGSSYIAGAAGGSGGGGGAAEMNGGSGTAGQGFQGGRGNIQNWSAGAGTGDSGYAGGGGGGAGGPGTDGNGGGPSYGYPGYGGPGIMSNITGTDKWYAGGGGGHQYYNTSINANGGSGVGGNGGTSVYNNSPATAGAPNTGSGGGAGGFYGEGGSSGAGGTGIVVIRYKTSDPAQYAYAPYVPLQATGGTVSESSSAGVTYRTHTFYNTSANNGDSFRVSSLGTSNGRVQVLVVAGGGGGGMDMGGGGGGGGVVYNASVPVYVGTIPVYVGKGGFGAPAAWTAVNPQYHNFKVNARQGANSNFGTMVTAIGGGYGGSSYFTSPLGGTPGSGGSGGGRGGYSNDGTVRGGAAGTAGQGNAGGQGGPAYYSGGGGGAGGAGANSTNQPNGGPGIQYTAISPYYFGGGGGGAGYSSTGGNGGTGGGGGGAVNTTYGGTGGINNGQNGGGGSINSQTNTPGGHAGANTGGGGGGGSHYYANNWGGNGGSGIVMVKYEISNTAATMHLPGVNYTYKLEVKCVEGNFTSPLTTAEHSFTPIGTVTASPSSAPSMNTPGTAISASGGTIQDYTRDGVTYRTHKFDSSGTFSVSSIGTTDGFIEYMVVGGGGGGGGVIGGGGGGGGVIESSTTVSATNYAITVGGGGLGGLGWNSYPQQGANGGNTVAFGTTALGGGGGGAHGGADGRTWGNSGGSGGGGGGGNCSQGGTFGQGKSGACSSGDFGGGGGGAGMNGWAYTPGYFMQNGGTGHYTTLTAGATYFGGGGGGGSRASWSGSVGSGGSGGGGNGSTIDTSKAGGMDGANGYGGGGGGAGHNGGSGNRVGGNGGSGTVVIRYVLSTTEPYAGMATKINVTSTGQCNDLHYGTTPVYNYYRNGVKFATTTATSAVSTDTSGVAGNVVTYDYTVQCQGTLNGTSYITPESAKSPTLTVTLKSTPPKITGGYVSQYTVGSTKYRTHTFYFGGNLNVASLPASGTVDILVVGGGGSGGAGTGGGGGAGGLIYINNYAITTSNYGVSVGNGGYNDDVATGQQGEDSVFGNGTRTLRAYGGGYGASSETGGYQYWGNSGGSGGGGQNYYGYMGGQANTQPSTTSDGVNSYPGTGFGNYGGNPASQHSGGGGGAGGAGLAGNVATNGGQGKLIDITGSASWYAAGGNGGQIGGSTRVNGIGGAHNAPSGTGGSAYTGSGGGGGWDHAGGYGGPGGSGFVVVRYIIP